MYSHPLWTRDFTIITIGTAISTLGNAISGFAISLLVLDHTGSTLLYTCFMAAQYLPKMLTPLLVGPYLDRMSRKKAIYRLDYLSSCLYFLLFLLIANGFFHYWTLLFCVMIIGAVDGTYVVAYDSFYPNLVAPGNFGRAYSIASLLYPLATFMLPVASLVYNAVGTVAPLFAFNSLAFFAAATFERSIGYEETHINGGGRLVSGRFKQDFREGVAYIRSEPGLGAVTAFFFLIMLAGQGGEALILPFFRNHPQLYAHLPVDTVTLYSIVTVFGVAGRLTGGLIHYRVRYPSEHKFTIALFVYASICVLHGILLFMPIAVMLVVCFLEGILSVTSYNIRISSTQAYVPDRVRARFNGTFQMMCNMGMVLGELIAGVCSEFAPERPIIVALMAVNLLGVYAILWPRREAVKAVYNRNV